jgi:hypothetical protein
MNEPNADNSSERYGEFDSPDDLRPDGDPEDSREEMLETMLEQTKHYLDKDSLHERFTEYVRENRLPSQFDFENLCELVRCVLQSTTIEKLSIDREECVNWIATCIYEDPLANERAARLWHSIIARIQG